MADPNELLVRDIMVPDPVTVTPATSVHETAGQMRARNIGAVIVATNGSVEGVFTERDLLRRAAGSREHWSTTPVAQFMTADPVTVSPDEPWAEAMALMDQRSIRHLPVVEHGKLVGIVSVRDLLHHRAAYLEALVQERTAELAARNTALVARDQQITRNLKVAARIQKRLLPGRLPGFEPFRFAVAFHGHDQVTGDYHDFVEISPDQLAIIIADASGHGVPAAFVSVIAKMCCVAYCKGLDSPSAMLQTMNEHLGDLVEAEHFITMFVAIVDRRDMTLRFARAGHPPPLWFRAADNTVTPLDASGCMLGIMPDSTFEVRQVHLQPGDKVLFFSDGVFECRNQQEQIYGTTALISLLRQHGRLPCRQLLDSLEQSLDRYRGDLPFDDDVTVIVLEVGEQPVEKPS